MTAATDFGKLAPICAAPIPDHAPGGTLKTRKRLSEDDRMKNQLMTRRRFVSSVAAAPF